MQKYDIKTTQRHSTEVIPASVCQAATEASSTAHLAAPTWQHW